MPVISLLHELNIVDKHRTRLIVRHQSTDMRMDWIRDVHPIVNNVSMGMIEDGADLGRWKPAGRPLDSEPDMEF